MAKMPTKSELKRNLKALKKRLEKRPMDLDARMRMARTHRLLSDKKPAVAHYRAVARYLSLSGHPLQSAKGSRAGSQPGEIPLLAKELSAATGERLKEIVAGLSGMGTAEATGVLVKGLTLLRTVATATRRVDAASCRVR